MAAPIPTSTCCRSPALLRRLTPSGAPPDCVPGRPLSLFHAPCLPPPSRLSALVIARSSRWFSRTRVSAIASSDGFWEDPDNGCGSDLEEDLGTYDTEEEPYVKGEEEKNVFGRRTGGGSTSTDSQFERLRDEVELLLSPEEKTILQQNEVPNLSKISSGKWQPYHTRAQSAQIRFMDELLQQGLDIDAADEDGLTALHKAVISKKEAVASHLLRKGANPHVKDRDGATPLHFAVQVGALQTVKLFIKYKADVNVEDFEGWTPLHLAMQSRSRDIAKILLVNGADKTRRNKGDAFSILWDCLCTTLSKVRRLEVPDNEYANLAGKTFSQGFNEELFEDGKTPLDLSLCYGRDFKSYELARLIKLVPANR